MYINVKEQLHRLAIPKGGFEDKKQVQLESSMSHLKKSWRVGLILCKWMPCRWVKTPRRLSAVHSPCQASEDVLDVGVVSTWLGDGDAQLCIAQSPYGCDDARDDPDDQREAHWAGVLHHTLRTDEDTWANDVTWEIKGKNNLLLDLSFSSTFLKNVTWYTLTLIYFFLFTEINIMDVPSVL